MSNILAQLYTASDRTSEQLDKIDTTLGAILQIETRESKEEKAERTAKKRDRRRAEQRAKRSAGDRKGLFGMMSKKDKEEEKKTNKGLLEGILGTLGGGILGILGSVAGFIGTKLLGAVTAIGGLLLGVIPKLFSLAGNLAMRMLKPLGNLAVKGISKALGLFKPLLAIGKGALLTKAGLVGVMLGAPVLIAAIAGKVHENIKRQGYGGGKGGDLGLQVEERRRKLRPATNRRGRVVGTQTDEQKAEDAFLEQAQERIKEADKRKKERMKEARVPVSGGRSQRYEVPAAAKEEIQSDYEAELKEIAVEYGLTYQKGGRVPTMLEPGEKVFAPGAWNAQIEMMNKMFPRFQNGGKIDEKAGAKVDGEKESYKPGEVKSGNVTPGGSINFIGDGSGYTGELKFMDGSGKHVGSYGGVSGVARTAGATQEQRRNQSGAYNPLPDGTYPIESPMGEGSAAIGSFGAWINNPQGNVGGRGQLFLHNDIGSDGTQGCVGVELGGSRGPNANTKKFIDLYDKVMPQSLSVNLADSSGRRFGPGDIGGGDSSGNTGGGGGIFDIGAGMLKTLGGVGGFVVGLTEGLFSAFGDSGGIFGDLFSSVAGVAGGALGAAFGAGEGAASAATGESLMPSGSPVPVTSGAKGLLDFIARYESGGSYTKIFGGDEVPNLTDKTIDEVVAIQKAHLRKGYESAAIGRYQMMYPEVYADKAGIPRSAKFSPENQDKMAMVYLEEDGFSKFKSGNMSADAFANNVAGTWAAMPTSSGRSAHAGVGSNASLVSREQFMKHVNAAKMQTGGIVSGRPSASIGRMKEVQEMFAEMIAEAAIVDPVVIYEEAPEAPTVTSAPSPTQEPPPLPNGPSTIQAAEYFFNLSLGGSLA